MSGEGPCAFHDQSMEQLRTTLLDIKEQMREGLQTLRLQTDAFAQAMAKIVDSQTARRELCAKQEQRLNSLEASQMQHRTDHATEREEYLGDRADFWAAINKLRFYVFLGVGIGLTFSVGVPIIISLVLKG